MGAFVGGVWHRGDQPPTTAEGRFERQPSRFRDRLSADGTTGFKAEAGRYHLYFSLGCPWAHRTVIYRALKRLDALVSVSVLDPIIGEDGWVFSDYRGCGPDPLYGAKTLGEIYLRAKRDYTGRVTVPVLWDKRTATIVNNESAEIIRMFNDAFAAIAPPSPDYYPPRHCAEIDALNQAIYDGVNNGVYKCGFATTQAAYDEAFATLFATLDDLERRLERQRYLVGDTSTEADWRLFTTLIRFDAVYHYHFKCNLRRIADYPALSGYLRDLYQVPGVAGTVDLDHIKRNYYLGMKRLNPSGIVPKGPALDFAKPHDRARLAAAAVAG